MTVDMTNNRVPYGLLTDEEKAALHEHEKAGGTLKLCHNGTDWVSFENRIWLPRQDYVVYRTVPLPKTQDVIAWDRLPEWVEWVARDEDGWVWCYRLEPDGGDGVWSRSTGMQRRIDDFPGIVQTGTCDWKDSKQRRPR
jgi:hypothetical protein